MTALSHFLLKQLNCLLNKIEKKKTFAVSAPALYVHFLCFLINLFGSRARLLYRVGHGMAAHGRTCARALLTSAPFIQPGLLGLGVGDGNFLRIGTFPP